MCNQEDWDEFGCASHNHGLQQSIVEAIPDLLFFVQGTRSAMEPVLAGKYLKIFEKFLKDFFEILRFHLKIRTKLKSPEHVRRAERLHDGHHLDLVPAELLNGEIGLEQDEAEPDDGEDAVDGVPGEEIQAGAQRADVRSEEKRNYRNNLTKFLGQIFKKKIFIFCTFVQCR